MGNPREQYDAAITRALDDIAAAARQAGSDEQAAFDKPIVDGLHAQVADLGAAVIAKDKTIADQAAEIARLTALIPAPEPDPTPAPTVAYGWNTGGWWKTAGQASTDAYTQAKTAFGTPKVLRLWPNSFNTSWAALIPSYVDKGVGVFVNLGSDIAGINAGKYDAAFATICSTAPTDRAVWLTVGHEPENDSGSFTMQQWQTAQARLARIKTANAKPNVRLAALLMGTTFMPSRYAQSATGNRPASEWFGFDLAGIDCLGTDIYQWGKADPGDTAALVVQPCIDLAKSLGKGLVVGELGSRNTLTDAARAKFLTDAVTLFDANADVVEAVAYFENDNGSLGPWNLLPKPGTNTPALPKAVAVWRSAVQS